MKPVFKIVFIVGLFVLGYSASARAEHSFELAMPSDLQAIANQNGDLAYLYPGETDPYQICIGTASANYSTNYNKCMKQGGEKPSAAYSAGCVTGASPAYYLEASKCRR